MNDKMKVMTKLHVNNLPANCTRRCLTDFFNKFGDVQECAIMWDTYAFVHYASMEEAQNALVQASNANLMGNKLSIKLSTSKNRQTTNWYQNKVIRLLNDTDSCESNVIVTKLYVTNLPENCNSDELKALFSQYGCVLECVVMWNHYAFVHFAHLAEAKTALHHLNGFNFYDKHLIVQLSTSSNRPLPKCVALKNGKNKPSSLDSPNWIDILQKGAELPVFNSFNQQPVQTYIDIERLSATHDDKNNGTNHRTFSNDHSTHDMTQYEPIEQSPSTLLKSVNYTLFPQVNKLDFFYVQEYYSTILDLINKNCTCD